MNVRIVVVEPDLYAAFQSDNSWFRAWQNAGVNKTTFPSIYIILHLLKLSFTQYCENLLCFFNHSSE